MSQRSRSGLAGLALLLSLAATIGTLIVGSNAVDVLGAVVTFPFVVIGVYIVVRANGNAVGWHLTVFGLLLGLTTLLEVYASAGLPFAVWCAWLASLTWLPAMISLLVGIPLTFPEGHLPGRRWVWVVWASVAGGFLFWVGNAFTAELLDAYGMGNPIELDIPQPLTDVVLAAAVLLLAASIAASMVAVVVRFRRSGGVERQQIKWFVSAALLLVPALVFNGWAYESGPEDLGRVVLMLAALGVAAAIAVAVLRYRLYDLNRIVSRTVTYTLVIGVLAAAFSALATVVGTQVSDDPLFVAAATLGAAAVFNPLRRYIQAWVDHRFNRSRYDSEQISHVFAASLQNRVELEKVVDGWVGVVSETMEPATIGVWVRGSA